MTKPPHIETIELSADDIERGIREQGYADLMTRFRAGGMPDTEWHALLQDRGFADWLVSI